MGTGFAVDPDELRALVRLVMRCAPAGERKVTMGDVAKALGVSRNTLGNWCAPRVSRARRVSLRRAAAGRLGRSAPYSAFYCLQVLAANPTAAWATVFSVNASPESGVVPDPPRPGRKARGSSKRV